MKLHDWKKEVEKNEWLNKVQAHDTLTFKENNVIALEEIDHQSYAFDMEKEIIYDHLVNKMSEVKK